MSSLAAAAQRLYKTSGVEAPFSLAFLTDQRRIPNPEIIARALPKGSAVILRDYHHCNRDALARRLGAICAARELLLIIGADLNLARSVGADGVHLPGWTQPCVANLDKLIVTTSCHTSKELENAAKQGADLAFLSPAFPTASHPGGAHLGAETVRSLATSAPLPVLALGGVNAANAAQLAAPNVAGLAAIGAFRPN